MGCLTFIFDEHYNIKIVNNFPNQIILHLKHLHHNMLKWMKNVLSHTLSYFTSTEKLTCISYRYLMTIRNVPQDPSFLQNRVYRSGRYSNVSFKTRIRLTLFLLHFNSYLRDQFKISTIISGSVLSFMTLTDTSHQSIQL